MKKKILFLMVILVSLFGITIPSHAASMPSSLYEKNSKIFGLLPKNKNSSLNWKRLDLECNANDVAEDRYFYETENIVEAKYFIENTSFIEQTEEYIFPFFEVEDSNDFMLKKTSINVTDEKITPEIRHIYSRYGTEFYFNDIIKVEDEYISNQKFRTDSTVHKVVAVADFSNVKDNAPLQFMVRLKKINSFPMVTKNLQVITHEGDTYILTFSVDKSNSSFEFYFIGERDEFTIECKENLVVEEEDMSLLDFGNMYLPSNISQIDWFNIIAQRLNNLEDEFSKKDFISLEDLTSISNVMTLLVFRVDYKPRQTTVIEISSPFFIIGGDNSFHFSGCMYSEIEQIYVNVNGYGEISNFLGGKIVSSDRDKKYLLETYLFEVTLDTALINKIMDVSKQIGIFVLTFILYTIPMMIMVILFIRRKNKSNFGVLYLQKFLAYTLSFFGLFCFAFSENDLTAGIVLLCGFGILTLITLLQNITRNCGNLNSLIIETMCWAMNIYYLIVNDMETIYFNIWIFAFIEFIFILLKIRKTAKLNPTLKKYLPVGILYTFENWMIYLYFSITLCTTFITSEVLEDYFEIFFLPFIFLFYFVGMILRYRFFFLKPFREFYKDLDLEALEKKIQKRQELPNLHPETINFYNVLLTQHCLAHSMEKTREYIKKTYLPKTKGYVLAYRGMNMRYGQTREELEHGYEVLKREYYNNKSALKSFDKFYKFWLPYYGTNPNQDIKKVYKYHRKNNEYSNAISLFVLIYYYKNENNINKVEELKKEFISKYGILTEFVDDLNAL